jgi:hypothetical protein
VKRCLGDARPLASSSIYDGVAESAPHALDEASG